MLSLIFHSPQIYDQFHCELARETSSTYEMSSTQVLFTPSLVLGNIAHLEGPG